MTLWKTAEDDKHLTIISGLCTIYNKTFSFSSKGNQFFLFFCFVTILLLKVPKGFLKKLSLDHEVPGCLICKILAKRFGAHQEEVLNQVGHKLL